MSGVLGESLAGEPKTVAAWAAAINAAGGLRCHKIKYLISDDGGDPNRHAALVQEMVERNKVVAFVFQAAPLSGFAAVDYINKKAIPVIGSEGGSPWFYESKYFFPNGTSGADGFSSMFAVPTQSPYAQGKTKYAVVSCIEAQACSGLDDKAEALAKRFHVQLVYKGKVSLTQPDYTSHCLRAQQAGAEVFVPTLDGNSVFRLAKSCNSIGYHPIYTSITSATREDFARDPLLENFIGGYFELPWFRTDNPLVAEMHSVLKRFAPDLTPGPQTAAGWSVAKLFEIAAQNVSEPPTSASILQGLYSLKNNPIGGLLQPVTYTESVPTTPLRDCFWATQIRGGKWTGADKMICPPKA
jgi:ABC-type branched-subunit amino acid transport system substrate-binding protein